MTCERGRGRACLCPLRERGVEQRVWFRFHALALVSGEGSARDTRWLLAADDIHEPPPQHLARQSPVIDAVEVLVVQVVVPLDPVDARRKASHRVGGLGAMPAPLKIAAEIAASRGQSATPEREIGTTPSCRGSEGCGFKPRRPPHLPSWMSGKERQGAAPRLLQRLLHSWGCAPQPGGG